MFVLGVGSCAAGAVSCVLCPWKCESVYLHIEVTVIDTSLFSTALKVSVSIFENCEHQPLRF